MAVTLPLGDVFGRLPARPAHASADDRRMGDLTILIGQAHEGRPGARDRLFERLVPELRRIARRRLEQADGAPTLPDATEQVHECYLRLLDAERLRPDDRPQFLVFAARVLRSLIVDAARARHASRQAAPHMALATARPAPAMRQEDAILELDASLTRLADTEPHLAEIAELHVFGGLDEPSVAEALALPERLVQRDWATARALLAGALRD